MHAVFLSNITRVCVLGPKEKPSGGKEAALGEEANIGKEAVVGEEADVGSSPLAEGPILSRTHPLDIRAAFI